jgi:hypothetical protein
MNIIITLIYSVLIIYILHYSIKFILLKEKIYNYKKNIKENFVEQQVEINNENMELELLNYLDSNSCFYQQENNTANNIPENKTEIIKQSEEIKEISPLDTYFETKIDVTKEIKNNLEEKKIKEKSEKVPKIMMKNKEIENEFENSWSYKNENIMNGGMIDEKLSPWDNSDNYSMYDAPF